MGNAIKLKIKTLSNLFIGGAPQPFEIGGIDQHTALDQEGFPCIPASSLKGALRHIVHEDDSDMREEIKALYALYIEKDEKENWPCIEKSDYEEATKRRIKERYKKALKDLSPEYLFGIEGFNNTPRLFFSDLLLCDQYRDKDKKGCFSIDMKNSIDRESNPPASNPRTYKAARSGLVFEGEISFYKMELLGNGAEALCKEYIIDCLKKFNQGIYRLGNSKSRGYGKVEVTIIDGSEALNI